MLSKQDQVILECKECYISDSKLFRCSVAILRQYSFTTSLYMKALHPHLTIHQFRIIITNPNFFRTTQRSGKCENPISKYLSNSDSPSCHHIPINTTVELQPRTFQWDLTLYLLIWIVSHINKSEHQWYSFLCLAVRPIVMVRTNVLWPWEGQEVSYVFWQGLPLVLLSCWNAPVNMMTIESKATPNNKLSTVYIHVVFEKKRNLLG